MDEYTKYAFMRLLDCVGPPGSKCDKCDDLYGNPLESHRCRECWEGWISENSND